MQTGVSLIDAWFPARYETRVSLRRAILAGHAGRPLPVVIALACYFDESFDEQVHVVAGYMGEVTTWDKAFAPAWSEVIDSAPHRITEFKASECRTGNKEFSWPWTERERMVLTSDLVSVILRTGNIVGMGVAFCFPGLGVTARDRRDMERNGYAIAVSGIFNQAYSFLPNAFGKHNIQDIQMVFDERKGFYGRLMSGYEIAKRYIDVEVARILSPPIPTNTPLPAIQAADLLANETFREIRARLTGDGVSHVLERLVCSQKVGHFAKCASWGNLEEYNSQVVCGRRPEIKLGLLYKPGVVRELGHWGVE